MRACTPKYERTADCELRADTSHSSTCIWMRTSVSKMLIAMQRLTTYNPGQPQLYQGASAQ